MIGNWRDAAQLRRSSQFGSCNGGWAYDAYPELETLDAGRSITIAEVTGPAVITNIHTTQHHLSYCIRDQHLSETERRAIAARGVMLEIYYNDIPVPAVRVPLGDFFADGCGGRAELFSSLFVEKAPESYNCFIPMPFEGSARVVLCNATAYDLRNYSFVEFERLPSWEDNLGYFHATWKRFPFQLYGATDQPFFHVDGRGHLIGRAWSICTNEPRFAGYHFVMEGNNEIRIDGDPNPSADYLGTEDSFGFSWGFQRPFSGLYNGINFVQKENPSLLSIYRFRGQNAIRFNESLDLRIDWSNEYLDKKEFHRELADMRAAGRVWVDYATTYYWYQESVGYEHELLMSLEGRVQQVLSPGPAQLEPAENRLPKPPGRSAG